MNECDKVKILEVIRRHMNKASEEFENKENTNINTGFWGDDTREELKER